MFFCCSAPSVREEEGSAGLPPSSLQTQSKPNGVAEEVVARAGMGLRQVEGDEERRQLPKHNETSGQSNGNWNGREAKLPRIVRGNQVAPLQLARLGSDKPTRGSSVPLETERLQNPAISSAGSFKEHPFGVQQPAASTTGHQLALTTVELLEFGLPLFTSDNIRELPSLSTQPISFLALETVEQLSRSGACRQSVLDSHDTWVGTPATPGRKVRNKLVPQFINSVCQSFFRIRSHKEYASVLRKLLKKDPLLTFALQKAMRYLRAGEKQSVSHATPDPSGQTSTLFGMRITPCVWSAMGHNQAALLVEHNVPYDPAEVMPRLMRDYAVLSHVPAILTLIDFEGKVLYQNASSLTYMGDLLSAKYDNRLSEGLLRVLFMYDLHNLEQMLEDVLNGDEWQGVVQVPVSLRHFLAANPTSEIIDVNGSFSGPRTSFINNNNMDLDFQIGNTFSSRGLAVKHKKQQQTPGYLMGRPGSSVYRNLSARDAPVTRSESGHIGVVRCRSTGGGPTTFALTTNGSVGSPIGLSTGLVSPPSGAPYGGSHSADGTASPFGEGTQGGSTPAAAPGHPPQQSGGMPEPLAPRKFMTLLEKTDRNPRSNTSTRNLMENVGAGAGAGAGSVHSSNGTPPLQPVQLSGQSGVVGGPDQEALQPVEEDGSSYDETEECYHEVHAIPLLDPVLDKQVIMLVQTDVTPRVELENKLADLTDAQLSMLEQLFPRHIIEYMLARVPSRGGRNLRELANMHEQVMVLFCDVVGFTSMSKEVEPSQVMHFLNELYEGFDELVDEYDMYKLDIVGDCYIVVAGLIKEDQDGFVCVDEMDEDQVTNNAVRIMQFAKAMLRESRPVLMPHNSEPVSLRIGIHTGPAVSGLVGAKMPKFTLFGDTINTASRMESTCPPGSVHVSDAFARLLPQEDWQSSGGVLVKGKGQMQTYLWTPKAGDGEDREEGSDQMDPEVTVRNLRRSLSRMNSFTSSRSFRTLGGHSSALSGGSSTSAAANPLATILTNIRGGDDSDDDGAGASSGDASSRPRSLVQRPFSARKISFKRRQSNADGLRSSPRGGRSDTFDAREGGESIASPSARQTGRPGGGGGSTRSRRSLGTRPIDGMSLRSALGASGGLKVSLNVRAGAVDGGDVEGSNCVSPAVEGGSLRGGLPSKTPPGHRLQPVSNGGGALGGKLPPLLGANWPAMESPSVHGVEPEDLGEAAAAEHSGDELLLL